MKSRQLLVGLLASVALLVISLILEETCWPAGLDALSGRRIPLFGLQGQSWGVILTAFVALAGWVCSALVAIRNSVKQHTVSTLLQSRLSAVFQERGERLVDLLTDDNGDCRTLTEQHIAALSPREIASVRYLLNYYEFIAVGIRHGDLDERLLEQTIRGIVCSLVAATRLYIVLGRTREHETKTGSRRRRRTPELRVYENLLWLYDKWKDEAAPCIA